MDPTHATSLLGRILLVTGLLIAGIGLLLMVGPRLPYIGKLPGDLVFGRGNFRVYLPITTSILLSMLLTLVLTLLSLFRR